MVSKKRKTVKQSKERKNNLAELCWKRIGVFGDSTCEKLVDFAHCRNCPDYYSAGKRLFDREIPAGYREEWAKILAGSKETEAPGTDFVVVFRLKNEWLALKTACFQEATGIRPVHTVPFRTDNVFRGLVNIHGELIPCVSVADILGLTGDVGESPERKIYKRMIVLNKNGERFVFAVDEILGIYRISQDNQKKAPATLTGSAAAHTLCVLNIGKKTVGFLDEEKFFESLKGSLAIDQFRSG